MLDFIFKDPKFYETFNIIDKEELQSKISPWGNSFVIMTEKDIEALRDGKILSHDDGEYGTFVMLKEGERVKRGTFNLKRNDS